MNRQVILVDENDTPIGEADKLSVHRSGELHRAFSVFLFDRDGRWLLQQRHPDKYHSGGLWTNTCCSHPEPGKSTDAEARSRLRMEMGIDTALEPSFQFHYRAELDGTLIEHELDHVFLGHFDGVPMPNGEEVCDWRWVETSDLLEELKQTPAAFTYWFRLVVPRVIRAVADTQKHAPLEETG